MEGYGTTKIGMKVEEGVIKRVDGGLDAELLKQWFESWHDERAYWISHVGGGCDHRADWNRMAKKGAGGTDDGESFYGVMQVAFGRDTSFLAGTDDVPAHMDFDCLRNAIALEAKQITKEGEVAVDERRQKQ